MAHLTSACGYLELWDSLPLSSWPRASDGTRLIQMTVRLCLCPVLSTCQPSGWRMEHPLHQAHDICILSLFVHQLCKVSSTAPHFTDEERGLEQINNLPGVTWLLTDELELKPGSAGA